MKTHPSGTAALPPPAGCPPRPAPISSIIGWLLMVAIAGCAALEAAQPLDAADDRAAAEAQSPAAPPARPGELAGDMILTPRDSHLPRMLDDSPGGGSFWLVIAMLAAGGAGWVFLWSRRRAVPAGRLAGRIQIEGTRALGNRQYLAVVVCDRQRFLVGVTPGGVGLVARLDDGRAADGEKDVS